MMAGARSYDRSSTRKNGIPVADQCLVTVVDDPHGASPASTVASLLDFVEPRSAAEAQALSDFAAASEIVTVPAGVLVAATEADEQGDLWLVLAGTISVRPDGRHNDEMVQQFEVGDCIGAFEGDRHVLAKANLVATTDTTVARLPAAARQALQAAAPAVWQRIHGALDHTVVSLYLASLPLFAGVPATRLSHLDADDANWVCLAGGDVLVSRDVPHDALYIVVHGRLEMAADGPSRRTGTFERGDTIGEAALLLGETRIATVRAARDSELVCIPGEDFRDLLEMEPTLGANLARHLATLLALRNEPVKARARPHTIALVPADGRPIDKALVGQLHAALSTVARGQGGHQQVTVLDAVSVTDELGADVVAAQVDDLATGRLTRWLSAHEARRAFVLFVADAEPTDWSRCALRQADVVVLVARARASPAPGWVDVMLADLGSTARQVLVLLHQRDIAPRRAAAWLEPRQLSSHHHVRDGHTEDIGRLARWIGGAAIGVVLSGGGARGFAHIGALAAIADCGLPIDAVGGASMGSVIAAQYAMGLGKEAMIAIDGREFPGCSVWGDLTAPVVSLLQGRSTVEMLQRMFGDTAIEDLPTPYFCVTCNLSRAEVMVHDRGPLWLWVRASSSVPGIGPPVAYRGDLLVDGGVLNNLPADVMRDRCPGSVVAIDVSAKSELQTTAADFTATTSGWRQLRTLMRKRKDSPPPTLMQILGRTTMLSSIHNRERARRSSDVYVNPPVDEIGPLAWDRINEAVDIGYKATTEQVTTWLQAGETRR